MRAMSDDPLAPLAELPGVFEAADAARAAIDGLLREPALRRSRGQVRAESRRRGAWASAQLAGATIELDDFDRAVRRRRSGTPVCCGSAGKYRVGIAR